MLRVKVDGLSPDRFVRALQPTCTAAAVYELSNDARACQLKMVQNNHGAGHARKTDLPRRPRMLKATMEQSMEICPGKETMTSLTRKRKHQAETLPAGPAQDAASLEDTAVAAARSRQIAAFTKLVATLEKNIQKKRKDIVRQFDGEKISDRKFQKLLAEEEALRSDLERLRQWSDGSSSLANLDLERTLLVHTCESDVTELRNRGFQAVAWDGSLEQFTQLLHRTHKELVWRVSSQHEMQFIMPHADHEADSFHCAARILGGYVGIDEWARRVLSTAALVPRSPPLQLQRALAHQMECRGCTRACSGSQACSKSKVTDVFLTCQVCN